MIEYKGYTFKHELSLEDDVIFGRLNGIDDIITFESSTVRGLENAFQKAVDDYLDICEQRGKGPRRPVSGNLNLRMGEDRHHFVSNIVNSTDEYKSINDFICSAIDEKAKKEVG